MKSSSLSGSRATLGSRCTESGVNRRASNFIMAHQPMYMDSAYSGTDRLEERRTVLQRWADSIALKEKTLE